MKIERLTDSTTLSLDAAGIARLVVVDAATAAAAVAFVPQASAWILRRHGIVVTPAEYRLTVSQNEVVECGEKDYRAMLAIGPLVAGTVVRSAAGQILAGWHLSRGALVLENDPKGNVVVEAMVGFVTPPHLLLVAVAVICVYWARNAADAAKGEIGAAAHTTGQCLALYEPRRLPAGGDVFQP